MPVLANVSSNLTERPIDFDFAQSTLDKGQTRPLVRVCSVAKKKKLWS
jgi:hypothetical protein